MSENSYLSDGREDDICPEMDELLCEYVDGTMDPTVRDVFEECICADPGLAKKVRELQGTRSLLNSYGHKLREERRRCTANRTASCGKGRQNGDSFGQRISVRTLAVAITMSLALGLWAGAILVGEETTHTEQVASPQRNVGPQVLQRDLLHQTSREQTLSLPGTYRPFLPLEVEHMASGGE